MEKNECSELLNLEFRGLGRNKGEQMRLLAIVNATFCFVTIGLLLLCKIQKRNAKYLFFYFFLAECDTSLIYHCLSGPTININIARIANAVQCHS